MGRPSVIPTIERRFDKPLEAILNDFLDQGRTPDEIAAELKIGKSSVYTWVKDFNLKSKVKSNSKSDFASYSGNGHGELGELIEEYVIAKEVSGKTDSTIAFYRDNLYRLLWWMRSENSPLSLASFNTESLRRFLHYVQTTKVRFGGKSATSTNKVKQSTINAYWRVLRTFANWLVDQGKLDKSPVKLIEKPKEEKVIVPNIPDELIYRVLDSFGDSLSGTRDKAIFLTFLGTGLRLKELTSIQLDDIDFKTGLFTVMGKGEKEREAWIGPTVIEAIQKYLVFRKEVAKCNSLWITSYGSPFTRDGIRKMIGHLAPGELHPHKFRHAWAIRLLRATGDVAALKELGGWADLSMPLRYSEAEESSRALDVAKKFSPVDTLMENNRNGKH